MNELDVDLREVMTESTLRHSRTPNLSFDSYREARYRDLERFLASKRSIYLDINYWWSILNPNHPRSLKDSDQLGEILRSSVRSGRVFCPVSGAVFIELMKCRNEQSRLALAKLMDELSVGIGIRNPFDIAQIEYIRFFVHFIPRLNQYVDRVWAPIGHIVQEVYPYQDEWPDTIMEQGRKVMCDVQWATKMTHLAKRMLPEFPRTAAQKINAARQIHRRGDKSFERLFADELNGVLEDVIPQIDEILRQMEQAGFRTDEIQIMKQQKASALDMLQNAAAEQRDNTVASKRVLAALYAAKRLDDHNSFTENDLDDFRHASVAVAYCDMFLCDRHFAALLLQSKVQNVIARSCKVLCDPPSAIATLCAI